MVARPGFPSLRRNPASNWFSRNSGNTGLMGCIYRWARASSDSSAPKKVRMGPSKHHIPAQAKAASITAPMAAAVKYWFSLPSPRPLPRRALNSTLPPMPTSRPRL